MLQQLEGQASALGRLCPQLTGQEQPHDPRTARSLGNGGVRVCRGGDSASPGVDRELRIRRSPAGWGREGRRRWRGLELGFEEEGQGGFGQAKKRKRAFHAGTE